MRLPARIRKMPKRRLKIAANRCVAKYLDGMLRSDLVCDGDVQRVTLKNGVGIADVVFRPIIPVEKITLNIRVASENKTECQASS